MSTIKYENYKTKSDQNRDLTIESSFKTNNYKIPKISATEQKPAPKLADHHDNQLKILCDRVNKLVDIVKEQQNTQIKILELIELFTTNLERQFQVLFENSESI